jgi:hypothetical protein
MPCVVRPPAVGMPAPIIASTRFVFVHVRIGKFGERAVMETTFTPPT